MKSLIAAVLMLGSVCSASDLSSQLNALAAEHKGKVAFFAKNMKTGQTIAINADTPVATASVIKLPIMLETFYEVKGGKHSLGERLALSKENQVSGSGVLTSLDPGLQPTLKDAVTLMIDVSDNTATNLVIDDISIAAINARLAAMGLKDTYLYKKVFKPAEGPQPPEQKKFGLGKTTAREMAEVMASIYRCDLGDKTLCEQMLSILRNQFYRDMIPRYLETADTTESQSFIANKTGALDEVRNDVALVMTQATPIIISIFSWDNQDQRWTADNSAELLGAKMAKLVVDAWAPLKNKPN